MHITIRDFCENDIDNKIKWINDDRINKFLHYDIPLIKEKTKTWFNNVKNLKNRYDAIIEADGNPVGLIGLLAIDDKNRKAEYYICIGEIEYMGKGIARRASEILLNIAFEKYHLNKVYLFTEINNINAQKLFKKLGFKQEGILKSDLIYNGKEVDRVVMGMLFIDYKSRGYGNSNNQIK